MQLARILEDWILDELCHPDGFVNGNALCPFARNAWFGEKVKTLEVEGDLWDTVYEEMRAFYDTYQVVVCGNYGDKYSYEELEAACFALNGWLAQTGVDIWLLAFKDKGLNMIFVQRLTDLDNASAKLQRLDYYVNYDPDDYQRLVETRKQRRLEYAGNEKEAHA